MANLLFNPLKVPTYVMAKPAGPACNLDCSYCYYLDKEELYPGRKSFRMSDEVLEEFIKSYIEAQPLTEVLFTWHGGEPLLRGIDFFRKALKWQRIYAGGRPISNSIQTNGTLLDDNWCRFLKEHHFLVGISIDGPEHCHDRYRRNKRGGGTFREVMRGIELLHRHRVEFNTLSVINNYTVDYPLEIYRFFKLIGSRFMQFSPVVERYGTGTNQNRTLAAAEESSAGEVTPWSVDPHRFGSFYIGMFDEWIRRDVGNWFVQLFDATLACTVGEQPGVCLFGETCGHASALEFNGDLYSCDHFVFPGHKLGNIKERTVYEMMFSGQQLQFGQNKKEQLTDRCKACEFLKLCRGECPKNRIVPLPGERYRLNYLCEGYRSFFRHSKPYMEFMAVQLAAGRAPAGVMDQFRS